MPVRGPATTGVRRLVVTLIAALLISQGGLHARRDVPTWLRGVSCR
jgi:hypothetical protein